MGTEQRDGDGGRFQDYSTERLSTYSGHGTSSLSQVSEDQLSESRIIILKEFLASHSPDLELAPPAAGDIIADRYRVVRKIAHGGMGCVYEVVHSLLAKSFALKVLHSEFSSSEVSRRGFFREARFASSLAHRNLPSIVDYGEDTNFGLYMVMELVDGVTLHEDLKQRGHYPLAQAIHVTLQVAEALAYMHQRHVLHCDIKNANIVLQNRADGSLLDRRIRLLDFGLAQTRAVRSFDYPVGTVGFVSPEIVDGEDATERSDIYSLGVVFYSLLAGTVPWQGATKEVLFAHMYRSLPRVAEFRGEEIPVEIVDVLHRALAKEPDDRFPTVREFMFALRSARDKLALAPRRRRPTMITERAMNPAFDILEAAFDQSPIPLAIVDGNATIFRGNGAFSRFVLGISIDLAGLDLKETRLGAIWSSLTEDLANALDGESIRLIIDVPSNDGERHRFAAIVAPLVGLDAATVALHELDVNAA